MKFLLLFLLLSTPALARIGETRAECIARYGKPVSVDTENQRTIHEKAGVEVTCFFFEDRCDAIKFTNLKEDSEGNAVSLTDEERKVLFEASSAGLKWTRIGMGEGDGVTFWKCEELRGIYRYKGFCYVEVHTREHTERQQASDQKAREKEDRERANLKDF